MANNKKINLDKAKKVFRVIEAVDKATDSVALRSGETDEIRQVKYSIRTAKQATRTEIALIRLQFLLIKKLHEIRKRKKLIRMRKQRLASLNGKRYLVVKKEYKPRLNKVNAAKYHNNKLKRTTGKYKIKPRKNNVVPKESPDKKLSLSKIKSKKYKVIKKSYKPRLNKVNAAKYRNNKLKRTKGKYKLKKIRVNSSKKTVKKTKLTLSRTLKFNAPKKKKLYKDKKLSSATRKVITESVALASTAIDPKVDKNKTTDTGIESVKQAISTTKKTVRTVNKSVKTVKTTIKTIKNTPKNIKNTIKNTKRIAKATVKVFKVAIKVASKILAFFAENPIVLAIILAVVLIAYIVYSCVALMSGSAENNEYLSEDFREAGGIEDVAHLKDALKLLEECKKEKKDKFYDDMLKDLYYQDDWEHKKYSDLIYETRYSKDGNPPTAEHPEVIYNSMLASDPAKKFLKDTFDWNCGIDDIEILSAAYVVAEIAANSSASDTYQVKDIKYTKDVINKVLDEVVKYKRVQAGYTTGCLDGNCEKIVERYENPAHQRACRARDKLYQAFSAWDNNIMPHLYAVERETNSSAQSAYWKSINNWISDWYNEYGVTEDYYLNYPNTDNHGRDYWFYIRNGEYEKWWNEAENTPEYIETTTYRCPNQHHLYSINLEFFPVDAVATNLGFMDAEKLWYSLTEDYFRDILSED